MKKFAAIVFAALLVGCATTEDFTTRVNCTLSKDQLTISSWWKFFAITVKASEKDLKEICKKDPAPETK